MTAIRLILAMVLASPGPALCQASVVSAHADSASSAAPAKPSLDFSGILFANYQHRIDRQAESANKFDIERVYLTFRMPAGDRVSVRVTADVFQQANAGNDAYYKGWTIRAKYAYLQFDYIRRTEWKANARIGLLHTVFIDYDEQFWPRWIAPGPTDRAAYFASSDAGIATTISFPRRFGELYATITNGPGYTSREVDRFKDYSARLTLTPFAARSSSPLRFIAVTGWTYKGAVASAFVNGGEGQIGRVGSALSRDRWGVHIGQSHPRATVAVEYASRLDEGEIGDNTTASPRATIDSTGSVASAYAVIRPFPGLRSKLHPVSMVARFDRVMLNKDTNSRYDFLVGGLAWDLSAKAAVSLDYQEARPRTQDSIAPTRTLFAHFVARF